jgi:molecular chaperone GrpE
VISLASLFRRSSSEATGHSDPTVEVNAQMIADLDVATNPAEDASESDVTEELLEQALAERKSLVQLCLYALDRARSPGVVERIEEGLAGIGVSALRPDGDVFDPAHHEAGGTVATADLTMDGVVAETEVVGFADRGRLLRAPIVIVYKAQQP